MLSAWKLVVYFLGDKHIDLVKRKFSSWGCRKGRIITVDFSAGKFPRDGVDHLLSLPNNIVSDQCNLNPSILMC